ncbi:hypothetical protein DBR06_SOUSAS44310002, partial [Sousa chinensis]
TAFIRFQSSVNFLMSHTVRAPPEGFPTGPTFKRLLLSVKSLMTCKMGAMTEGLPTVTARIQ